MRDYEYATHTHLSPLPTHASIEPDLDIGVSNRGFSLGAGVGEVGQTSVDGALLLRRLLLAPDLNHEGSRLQVVQCLQCDRMDNSDGDGCGQMLV